MTRAAKLPPAHHIVGANNMIEPPARFALGTCEGRAFRIRVAHDETLAELKAHFRATVGHDRIGRVRWITSTDK